MALFLRLSLVLYLVATTLGVVLRTALVAPVEGLNFQFALHAHSHTLYFGWAALALFALFYERLGATDRRPRLVLWGVVVVAVATFGAFLYRGYGPPGVIVSTVALVVWAFAIGLFLWRARGMEGIDLAYLRVSVVYIGIAGCSALARVVILFKRVEDPLPGRLAVFGFLHAFAGFCVLGLMGLLARYCEERGARLDERRLRWQLWLLAPLAALTFPLGVPGGMDSALGPPARVAAVLLAVPAALWVHNLWTAAGRLDARARPAVRTLAAVWAFKAALELLGAFGLAETAAAARHPAVLYLHVMLLGVVTASLLLLSRASLRLESPWVVHAHQGGVAVMTLGLGLASGPAFFPSLGLPLVAGLWVATAGGFAVVLVGVVATVEAWLLPPAAEERPAALP